MPATLTRIIVNRGHGLARADLADRPGMHKTLMRLLTDPTGPNPRKTGGLLFRLEAGLDPVLLVQTADLPDLTALPAGYGTADTRDLTPLLTALTHGLPVRYRITAAPTAYRASPPHPATGRRPRGTITSLQGPDALTWWQRRAAAAGLQLAGQIEATPRPFPSPKRPAPFYRLTQFDGTATVTDPAALTTALHEGIGKGKAYGAGLLTLASAGPHPSNGAPTP
ncbi:type I-E CRISPR-associated protein Cas6/Cse3/CasE [Streptomyces sp. NBC_01262]|uniref:type I-E CRISPR-associated protein Cas6/Cse3/CasE n=1 Tax=Streptomyces sp. NBC_01262 TaxID=2903803 RepID=UPI002E2F16A1|nr:type I-E CRISPR-associated protein Cas6/Cse3/CasE [Streptomyces sp. NBC_01262]